MKEINLDLIAEHVRNAKRAVAGIRQAMNEGGIPEEMADSERELNRIESWVRTVDAQEARRRAALK